MDPEHGWKPSQHPIGTLVILLIYGALFAVGWLLLYFMVFLPRGPVTG